MHQNAYNVPQTPYSWIKGSLLLREERGGGIGRERKAAVKREGRKGRRMG